VVRPSCQETPGFSQDPHHPIIEHTSGDIFHRGASAKTNSHIAQPWENSALNTTTRFNHKVPWNKKSLWLRKEKSPVVV
jgi:hypothetical protein